ncbi:MAG TPA: GNAT family N-acetyltransferase [Steroidobacteraceae bacterium]
MSANAELRFLVNPVGMCADIGAHFLTRCFATRWTEAMCRWYLQRPFADESPDRLILVDDKKVVAGCGLAYRLLRTPDAVLHPVSVVVAACTEPGERGRGCYARLLEGAIERSASRGCTALLGFVTADNATGRGLVRLGATAVPSAYIFSAGRLSASRTSTLGLCIAPVSDTWPTRAGARLHSLPGEAGFHYPDVRSWRSQMVERPHSIQSLCVGRSSRALLEQVGDTDRLQWLDATARERVAAIRTLASYARRRRQNFFMYSTRPDDAAAARRIGLSVRPGFMMALAPESRHEPTVRGWARLSWHVQSGDRL